MIQIVASHVAGTYANKVELTLTLVGNEDPLDYGIAQSVIPNVWNFKFQSEINITIGRSSICNYYVFDRKNKQSVIGEQGSLVFNINNTIDIENNVILDTTSLDDPDPIAQDYFIMDWSAAGGSYETYILSQNYKIDEAYIGKKILPTDYNAGDYNTLYTQTTKRGTAESKSLNKPVGYDTGGIFGVRHINLLWATEESDNASMSNMTSVVYDRDLYPCTCPNLDDYTYKTSSWIPTSDRLQLRPLGKKECQDFYDTVNNKFELHLTDKHGQTHIEEFDSMVTPLVKQWYQLTFLDTQTYNVYLKNEVSGIITTPGDQNQTGSYFGQDVNPERPIIDHVILDNKVTIKVPAIANALLYKIHSDSTSYDSTSAQIRHEINRTIDDFVYFDTIPYKEIEIDCNDTIASIEAYVQIGILSRFEGQNFLNNEILPHLTKIDDYSNYSSASFVRYSPSFPVEDQNEKEEQNEKNLTVGGCSDITKQIISVAGTLKENEYDIIVDDYDGVVQIVSHDSTTFSVDIRPLNDDEIIHEAIKAAQLWTRHQTNDFKVSSLYVSVPSNYMSYEDSFNACKAVNTKIVEDGKMKLVYGMWHGQYLPEAMMPFEYETVSFKANISEVDTITFSRNPKVADGSMATMFNLFTNYNIFADNIEVTSQVFVSAYDSETNFTTIRLEDCPDSNIIKNALVLRYLEIYEVNDTQAFFSGFLNDSIATTPTYTSSFTLSNGFGGCKVAYATNSEFEDLAFTDPFQDDKVGCYLRVVPHVRIWGGGAAVNGGNGFAGKQDFNSDTAMTMLTQPVGTDTYDADSTNMITIDVNYFILNTNNYLVISGMMNDEGDGEFTEHLNVHNKIAIDVDNITRVITPYGDIMDSTATSFDIQFSNSYTSYPYYSSGNDFVLDPSIPDLANGFKIATPYPRYMQGESNYLTAEYMMLRGNYFNPDTSRVEFDLVGNALPKYKYHSFPKYKVGDRYETMNYNRETPISNTELIYKASKVLPTDTPLIPVLIPVKIKGYGGTWSWYIYSRACGEGGIEDSLMSDKIWKFPTQNDEWQFTIDYYYSGYTGAHGMAYNYPTTRMDVYYNHMKDNLRVRCRAVHKDGLYSSFTWYIYIGEEDWMDYNELL